jgi:DNA-binding NarL/FixJ family response regulator
MAMTKRRVNGVIERPVIVLFNTDDDLTSGMRLLLKSRRHAAILRLGPTMTAHTDPANIVPVRGVRELRAWLRSSRRRPMPTSFLLALKTEFDVHHQTMAALTSMGVRLPHLLSSGQDQIFVLDREQRIVAFFGHWPKESPRGLQDLLGKRKRDIFSPDVAAVHEAAGLRALNGEEAAYEWSITDLQWPVHLLTAASPLRNDVGEVAGILLVTRNITRLKQAQLEMEKSLQQKTSQLLEVERGVRKVAAALQGSTRDIEHANTSGLHTRAFLSKREHQILTFLSRGVRLRSIAQTLGISVETVRRHVKTMFRKTGVHSQESLVKLFSLGGEESQT